MSERGIAVPGEVAVAGFDDIPKATYVIPALTIVIQDTMLDGKVLVDSLLRMIRNEPVESRTLPMRLAVRKSSLCGVAV